MDFLLQRYGIVGSSALFEQCRHKLFFVQASQDAQQALPPLAGLAHLQSLALLHIRLKGPQRLDLAALR